MRWRVLFLISLIFNVALAAAWLVSARRESVPEDTGDLAVPASIVKTNVVVRRQFFTWSEVESTDYPTYVANLRDIGCPEQTIRDIIIADVNALFSRRLALEIVTPEQQWWRPAPDPKVIQAAAESTRALDQERRALLARLLGPDWETRDLTNLPRPTHPGVPLDGRVLGAMTDEAKQAVQDISDRAQERLQAYLQSKRQQGLGPDPAELARLRQQTRDELTRVLTPPQLEEYLLRYSQSAKNLRNELGGLRFFEPTQDEFRAMFHATDSIDQQLELLAGATDPNSAGQREALLQQRENALRIALGARRFQQYLLLHDPAYQAAVEAAQRLGDPGAVQALYQINLAAAQQQAAIRSNASLSDSERAIELKRTELQQLQAAAIASGHDISPPPPPPPVPEPEPAPPMRTHPHVLGVGETAANVATLYGVPLKALQEANPGVNLNKLKRGDSILIPDPLSSR